MDTPVSSDRVSVQPLPAEVREPLEKQINNASNWFYVIAALSLVNSVIFLAGSATVFAVGLGVTQFADGFFQGLGEVLTPDFGPGAGTVLGLMGLGFNLLIAGMYVGLGLLTRKRYRGAVITGLVLYGLDGLLLLAVGDWVSLLFHALALVGMATGLKAMGQLRKLEQAPSIAGTEAVSV